MRRGAAVRYSAFISYNRADRAWASWLHGALERYRIPRALRGREGALGVIGARLPPVFQDRAELAASANLAQSVQDALAQSDTLVVICSPNAARSRWVNEEVKSFIEQGRGSRIQCLVVGGGAGPRPVGDPLAAFPPALLEGGVEPLAADVRQGGDGKRAALLKLVAGMLGVGFDELRRRDAARRQRQLATAAGFSTAGLAGTSALAVFALISRHEAIEQRDIARQRTATAERTVDFVKSMFQVANPSEAKGETITAREILDRGARRISSSLSDEPAVKTELLTSLGEVYTGLGLFHKGDALIRSTFKIAGSDPRSLPEQYAVLGESQALQGDYAGAAGAFDHGLAAARDPAHPSTRAESRLLVGLSEARASLNQFPQADAAAVQAIASAKREFGPASPEVARAEEALGLSAFFAGKLDPARRANEQALAMRIRRQGELHPSVNADLNMLGSIAYLQHDTARAAKYYRRVLTNMLVVLGPDHPDIAALRANLGRIQVERGQFKDAADNLRAANAIYARERDATHDDLAFTDANLALAERGLGHPKQAETLFGQAIAVARLRKHRNLAPAMTDLADLLCSQGEAARGLTIAEEARPIMVTTYAQDAARVAWVDHVRASCLLKLGRPVEAKALLATSTPPLLARWDAGTLYGRAVRTTAGET